MSKASVLILRTAGTNCDLETKFAFEQVGAKADLIHINKILENKRMLKKYDIFVIPGGFTYGDDISAGKILANELKYKLGEEFVVGKKLILGICNGFQVLVKMGILPFGDGQKCTLLFNKSGVFQCEWIKLKVNDTKCVFTKGIKEMELPIAHAEGRFFAPPDVIDQLWLNNQVVVQYKDYNPNGSIADIAGICDPTGRIFGLMPHPERFIFKHHHPHWTRKNIEPHGIKIFKNAIEYYG